MALKKMIDKLFMEKGFKKYKFEHEIYVTRREGVSLLIICLYIQDLFITGSCEKDIDQFKTKMKFLFEMNDLGKINYFLRVEFLDISM